MHVHLVDGKLLFMYRDCNNVNQKMRVVCFLTNQNRLLIHKAE